MHQGLNGHTPFSVHFGTVDEVIRKRQQVMDAVFAENPERFSGGKPLVKEPPKIIGIRVKARRLPIETKVSLPDEEWATVLKAVMAYPLPFEKAGALLETMRGQFIGTNRN